jgi:hypothetical protein
MMGIVHIHGTLTSLCDYTAARTLFPPRHTCLNTYCAHNQKHQLLTKAKQRQAILYTLDNSAVLAWSVHLYCEGTSIYALFLSLFQYYHCTVCKTNYHLNYSVKCDDGANTYTHTYYDWIPEIIQVGEHQFVKQKVINLWIMLMMVSWYLWLLVGFIMFLLTHGQCSGYLQPTVLIFITSHCRRSTNLLPTGSLASSCHLIMYGMGFSSFVFWRTV